MRRTILKIFAAVAAVTFFCCPLPAQKRITPEEYIAKYRDISVNEMKKCGIPASITLAQGGLESGWGNSELARNANNHFGIKCHGWKGASYRKDAELKNECFRKYSSAEDSYRDHSDFLRYRDRYAFLFQLSATDYKGWANGLLSAGYSTNPNYANLLINLIEKYNLDQYDTPGNKRRNTVLDAGQVTGLGFTNGVPYVIAGQGDTYASIAKSNYIYRADLLWFNDATRKDTLIPGTKVYLERKKGRGSKKDAGFYVAAEGDTYHSISQMYGIKLKSLLKINGLDETAIPAEGDTVYLRKKRKK